MSLERENPAARERGRAEDGVVKWTSKTTKHRKKVQALTDDLEAVADWRDELADLLNHSWAMSPRQFERLEIALAAFAAFSRLCELPRERQQERRAA